jgi:hypothetical protein
MNHRIIVVAALASLAAGPAVGQGLPQLPGGAASILGGGLPNISGLGLPNVAGVLGYCAKQKILSGSGVSSLVDGLSRKPGVKTSPDYRAGSAGNIVTGRGAPLSLGSLPSNLKTQACNMVMEQGTRLL